MKVSDVIKNCFVKLGYGVVDVTDAENLTAEQKRLVDILLCSVENVHSEIISAYFPFVMTENVTLVDEKLQYSTLTNPKIVYPISLKRGAETRKIKAYPTYIQSDFPEKRHLNIARFCRRIRFRPNFRATSRAGFCRKASLRNTRTQTTLSTSARKPKRSSEKVFAR